jgi:hypothetical protein
VTKRNKQGGHFMAVKKARKSSKASAATREGKVLFIIHNRGREPD